MKLIILISILPIPQKMKSWLCTLHLNHLFPKDPYAQIFYIDAAIKKERIETTKQVDGFIRQGLPCKELILIRQGIEELSQMRLRVLNVLKDNIPKNTIVSHSDFYKKLIERIDRRIEQIQSL